MVAPRPAAVRGPALLLLFLLVAARGQEQDQTTDWRATLKTIRNGIHKIDTYLNAALDLLGGEDGLCQYKCRDGEPRGARGGRGMEEESSFSFGLLLKGKPAGRFPCLSELAGFYPTIWLLSLY